MVGRGSLIWAPGMDTQRTGGAAPAAGVPLWRRGREEKNCEFSGSQLGQGAERARPNHHPDVKRLKIPTFSLTLVTGPPGWDNLGPI